MDETPLTSRKIAMVTLAFVIVMDGLFLAAVMFGPQLESPEDIRREAKISRMILGISTSMFSLLAITALDDRRKKITRAPAYLGRWFYLWFGVTAVVGGIVGIAYAARTDANGVVWIIHSGLVFWGVLQSSSSYRKLQSESR